MKPGDRIADYSGHERKTGVLKQLGTNKDAHLIWYIPDNTTFVGQTSCVNRKACRVIIAPRTVWLPQFRTDVGEAGLPFHTKELCDSYYNHDKNYTKAIKFKETK